MSITIRNEYLQASFKSAGAELTSLVKLKTNEELIWEANPVHWGRSAPILFPFVGGLKDGSYTFNGQHYECGKHGFVRDPEFELVSQSTDDCTFKYQFNEETLKMYPIKFELFVEYKLWGNKLINSFKVNNLGDVTMPFSLGGHPAFKCPLGAGSFEDAYLQFEKPEKATQTLINMETGLCREEVEVEITSPIQLDYVLFGQDALIYSNLKSNIVTLGSNAHHTKIKFDFTGWEYMAFWTMKGAPFICLEPWCGIADFDDHNGRIEDKKAIRFLDANDSYEVSFGIEVC